MRQSHTDFRERLRPIGRTVLGHTVYRLTAIVLLASMVLAGLVLWQYRSNIFNDAQRRSTTLAYLLAEQTTRTFQAVDLTLTGLDAVFRTTQLQAHAPSFERLLEERVAELDFIHALYVVDPSGRVTQTSGELQDPVSNLSAQPYVQAFARDPTLRFLIGQPLFSRHGPLTAIPVVRRLGPVNGRSPGLIIASVEPRYFTDLYGNVPLDRGGTIDLYQDNGSILLASTGPSKTALVPPAAITAPTFDVDTQLGLFRTRSGLADQQLVAYHRAQGYPLVVAVGIDLKDLRSRWWKVAGPTLAAMAIAALMGIALAVLIVRRLEERRQARNRAMMMQKLEALGQMTASVSHDFRNLLAVMQSTIRLIRKQGPSERILSAAEEAIDRGSGLVTQLLAFSRRHVVEIHPADLNQLLAGLTQVLEHAAGPGVTLRIEPAPGLPVCRTDQTQFDAALMNLVVNAAQAMPLGGAITISMGVVPVGTGERPKFVELRVTDSGSGIAPGDLKRIFEPFFTTKADTGTGLGLSQVYGFMQQIGGDVAVASALGEGTTFKLKFPIVESDAAAPAPRGPTKAPRRLAAPGDETLPILR